MCHQLAFWYKALNLAVPATVQMSGGIYLWKDGREVPDTMNVSMEHEEELLYTWDSGFGNDQLKITEDALGDNGTISHTPQSIIAYETHTAAMLFGSSMPTGSPVAMPCAFSCAAIAWARRPSSA